MKDQLLGWLRKPDYVPATLPDLFRHLNLADARRPEFRDLVRNLERTGQLVRIKGERYILPREADLIPGRIRINRQGKGFLIPDDPALREIVVPERATGTALHEDRVLVRRDVAAKGLRSHPADENTGSVIRILERRRTQLVGTLRRGRHLLFVVPDDPRIPHDIAVPEPRDVGRPAREGDKVVVDLKEWESDHTQPEGEIIEVLGAPDEEGVDMLSVLRQYNLPLHFPRRVLQEARAHGDTVTARDIAGRVDCRSHPVITIDPDDAKDFDDAISLERGDAGRWRLWVHIADVSHYVKAGTALDAEARNRGNSTYLVDRVIPMLPEALSNELCSLRPQVDRLTKAVEFVVADDGQVLNAGFHSAVIRSRRRFTYREALEILRRPATDPTERMLHDAHRLAQRLRKRRFREGALDLDFPEMKIRLDAEGRVDRIEKIENDESHQLIEEFMLLANEAVARRLVQTRIPAIHRVHEAPDERRLREYREEVLTHNVPCGNLSQRTEVQRLLHRLDALPIGAALKIGFLKSLMRARYAVEPLGHYGLAKRHYAHFTSPIRRYADLVVHRALFDRHPEAGAALKETADHLSITERNSSDAERDSKDVKLFAYLESQLQDRQPRPYPALVTDVRNFGFFVDVPDLAMSGLVPLSTIQDEFYAFDASRGQLVGRRTRQVIRLGDRLNVQVAKVDRAKKQVDFRLVPAPGQTRPQRPGRRTPGDASRPGPTRPARPARPARPDRTTRADRPQRPDRPERPERPDRRSRRPAPARVGTRPPREASSSAPPSRRGPVRDVRPPADTRSSPRTSARPSARPLRPQGKSGPPSASASQRFVPTNRSRRRRR